MKAEPAKIAARCTTPSTRYAGHMDFTARRCRNRYWNRPPGYGSMPRSREELENLILGA